MGTLGWHHKSNIKACYVFYVFKEQKQTNTEALGHTRLPLGGIYLPLVKLQDNYMDENISPQPLLTKGWIAKFQFWLSYHFKPSSVPYRDELTMYSVTYMCKAITGWRTRLRSTPKLMASLLAKSLISVSPCLLWSSVSISEKNWKHTNKCSHTRLTHLLRKNIKNYFSQVVSNKQSRGEDMD